MPLSDLPCLIFPLYGAPPEYWAQLPSPPPPRRLLYETTHKNTHMEFMSDGSIGVFAAQNFRNGSTFIYRDEYIILNNWPVSEATTSTTFNSLDYTSFNWIGADTLAANATLLHPRSNSVIYVSFIYEFNNASADTNSRFKFSVQFDSTPKQRSYFSVPCSYLLLFLGKTLITPSLIRLRPFEPS